jgi:hypothetical protein
MALVRTKKRRRRPPAPALLPLLLAIVGAAGVLVRRRTASSSSSASSARENAGAPPSEAPAAEVVEATYTCECGQEYRVTGQDRHRVYWVAGAEVSDPVLGSDCVECGRPLPHDHAAA